ncbi:hypothetical protein KVQ01_11085 [Escherichia coli]|uniref:hypothetical protein n=1 Tax=Escherichia coli TaxID=562 RepID=UPI001F06C5A3|nr:hypothetical protein [Escherichia coli]MCH0685563.1 hypothetical protein [Escherichia coli]MDZ8667064.1 hypothetical protein [Escherichia coli]WRX87646.1 hypothetical protein SM938_22220 [Escherichia coli]
MTSNLDEVDMQDQEEKFHGIVNVAIDAFCSDRNIPKSVAKGSKTYPEDEEFYDSYTKSLRHAASELKIDYEVLKQLAEIESKTGIRPNLLVTSRGHYEYAVKCYSIKTKKGPKRSRIFSILAWRR